MNTSRKIAFSFLMALAFLGLLQLVENFSDREIWKDLVLGILVGFSFTFLVPWFRTKRKTQNS